VERTLRVGWVTPSEQYAEYAATTGDREDFLEAVVGQQADPAAAVTVGGTEWDVFVEPDGSTSYVQAYGQATVVVGTKRATAGQEELAVLLGSLTTG
jgi:hypothetical protein